ncbi:MAG: hypothetical protein GF375_06925 [Candidatus Omnitrophica bacterium]|nr:hypothetical protein [Candidatus Omnitrophota bacterium]MBD3269709.1 hypothetical protein [Candidatus Omnitrophota bacterium]
MESNKEKRERKKSRIRSNIDFLMALFILIRTNKKWWLLPLLLILGFLGIFISLTGNQSILPAIYALF